MAVSESPALQQVLEDLQLKDDKLDKSLSNVVLEKVASSFHFDLNGLSAYLDLENDLVEDIEHDSTHLRGPEKRRQFLQQWKKMQGAGATYKRLVNGLLQLGDRNAAEKVCKLVKEFDPGPPNLSINLVSSTTGLEVSSFRAHEKELVNALKDADLESLVREGTEMRLIPQEVQKSFSTLKSIKPSLKARYLLLHACEGLDSNPGQCQLWLEALHKHGVQDVTQLYGDHFKSPENSLHQVDDCSPGSPCKPSSTDGAVKMPSLKIRRQSFDTEVAEGQSALLMIKATSEVSISYQWEKDGVSLREETDEYLGTRMPVLCVREATSASMGKYACLLSASNEEGTNADKSGPIELTVKISRVKEVLISRYSNFADVQSDKHSRIYTNLALIKEKEDTKAQFSWSTIQGDADDVKQANDEVQYSDVFGTYKSGHLLLIEGRPGSGKTTLVHKVSKDWAKNEEILKGANFVFLVLLRTLPKKSNLQLLDILEVFYHNDARSQNALDMIEKTNGERVCFIFDGLDEYSMREDENSIVSKLMHKTCLSHSMVIVASRPVATAELRARANVCVEVLGFLKDDIYRYIENFKFSGSTPLALKFYLEQHSSILHMCFLPFNAFMICFLYDEMKGELPQTESGIYKHFTLRTLARKSSQDRVAKSFDELHGSKLKYFKSVCKIAFDMAVSNEQVFEDDKLILSSDSEKEESSLGLITIDVTEGFYSEKRLYSFVHLTFQEYLAAYHLSTLPEQEQVEIITKYGEQQHMQVRGVGQGQ